LSLLSPYPLRLQHDGSYHFVTKDRSRYVIYLTDGSAYVPNAPFSNGVVMLGFYPDSVGTPRPDERISLTIVHAIRLFFQANPTQIIVYVCDSSDGRQRSRMRLFTNWFGHGEENLTHITHEHSDADFTHYAGLLIQNDNPWHTEVLDRAAQFVREKFGE